MATRIVALMALLFLSGCFSHMSRQDKFHDTENNPPLTEVRQKPTGELALVFTETSSAGAPAGASAAPRVHVLEVNMQRLGSLVAAQTARPQYFDGGFFLRDPAAQGTLRFNTPLASGNWHPALSRAGWTVTEASKKLSAWFAPDIAVIAPGEPFVWRSPSGPRPLAFAPARMPNDYNNCLPGPGAILLDMVTCPAQAGLVGLVMLDLMSQSP